MLDVAIFLLTCFTVDNERVQFQTYLTSSIDSYEIAALLIFHTQLKIQFYIYFKLTLYTQLHSNQQATFSCLCRELSLSFWAQTSPDYLWLCKVLEKPSQLFKLNKYKDLLSSKVTPGFILWIVNYFIRFIKEELIYKFFASLWKYLNGNHLIFSL